MTERIHDNEPDTSEPIVRTLLEVECPQWSMAPVGYLKASGTSNAMWRVRVPEGLDVVVRLPRRPEAAAGVAREMAVLQQIEGARIASIVSTPTVRHVGHSHEVFPHPWSVLEWIDGVDAWTARDDLSTHSFDVLAADLARAVTAIGEICDVDVPQRPAGSRGGPLQPLLEQLGRWLDNPEWNAASLIDVDAVRRLAAEAFEVVDEPVADRFVHGDLIPGNLLIDKGRLAAVIDWGGVGRGDPAQDFAPAWAVLAGVGRASFREAIDADDAAWIRGRTFALEQAVGGVLYYVPRRHPLGGVMARTLGRILTSDDS